MGTSTRPDYILNIQRHSVFGPNLLVTVATDRDPGDFTALRITGRLPESTFPFHYATLSAPATDAVSHFRLSPPRLAEDSRTGLFFEVSSKPTSFPATKLFAMECRRRVRKEHLWIAAAYRTAGSLTVRLEMLSVGVTALFAFQVLLFFSFEFSFFLSNFKF